MDRENINIAERARLFVLLLTLGGAGSAVSGTEGLFDGGEGGAAAAEGVAGGFAKAAQRMARPVIDSAQVADRFKVSASMHQTTNFLEQAFMSLVDIGVVLIIWGFTLIAIWVVPAVIDDILRRVLVSRHVRAMVKVALHVGIGIFGVWFGLATIGINFLGVIVTFGVVGIVMSNGLSAAIQNAVAGMFMTSEDFMPGTRLEIMGKEGTIVEVGFFSTRMRLDNGNTRVITNATFMLPGMAYEILSGERAHDDDTRDALQSKNIDYLRSRDTDKNT